MIRGMINIINKMMNIINRMINFAICCLIYPFIIFWYFVLTVERKIRLF